MADEETASGPGRTMPIKDKDLSLLSLMVTAAYIRYPDLRSDIIEFALRIPGGHLIYEEPEE